MWPDGQLDVCVQSAGAAVDDAGIVAAVLGRLPETKAGTILGLDRFPTRATTECSFESPLVEGQPNVESARRIPVDVKGPFDLVIHVYPQAFADRLGQTWQSRVVGQEYVLVGSVNTPVTPALFVGAQEYADEETMFRLVAFALGLAGLPNDARPYIDGECVRDDPSACGPSYPEPAGPGDEPLPEYR